jgi:hypothetical protein
MKRYVRCSTPALWLLATALIAAPALAQDDAADTDTQESVTDSGRIGVLYAEVGVWVAQPTGLDYSPATDINPDDPLDVNLLNVRHGTDDRERVRVGWAFNNRIGEFVLTYYSHEDREDFGMSDPGVFRFGEVMSHPLNAGLNDDGRADSFFDDTNTLLRDLRVDYYRPAFSNDRASAKWFVGIRRVYHKREQRVTYDVLVPGLPALIPPLTQPRALLVPFPDVVEMESEYEGRGVEAGMDFLVPLWKKKILVEAGFAVAALRGETDSRYTSATHFYARVVNGAIEEVLEPPYTRLEEFVIPGDPNSGLVINDTVQLTTVFALDANDRSTTSSVIEGYLGFRWKAWKGLDVFGGFRDVYYSDAGIDLRPKTTTVGLNGAINITDVDETKRNVGYEGFYFGVGYSY